MNPVDINPKELESIFAVIGLSSKEGIQYRQRMNKHRQVFDFLIHIEKAISKLSTKRTLTIVDCACGRSYLSFIANYYLHSVLNRKVRHQRIS